MSNRNRGRACKWTQGVCDLRRRRGDRNQCELELFAYLLFSLAIPYYHFGVRTIIPIGKVFTGGVQVVQGWNNIYDNNSGKTNRADGGLRMEKGDLDQRLLREDREERAPTRASANLFDTTVRGQSKR